MIEIRDAKLQDAEAIQVIFYKTWLATYPNEEHGITREDIEDRFKDYLNLETLQKRQDQIRNMPKDQRLVVATDGGAPIGLCRIVLKEDRNQLQAMYVLPEYQGKGVGRKLWDFVRQSFDPKKPTAVEVAVYNKNAQAFYKKLGFKETGKEFTDERFRMKSGNMIRETEMVMSPEK